MQVETALELIPMFDFGPQLRLEAVDHTHRYESAVKVTTHYDTVSTDREVWKMVQESGEYLPEHQITARADHVILVGECNDIVDLMLKVIVECLGPMFLHEIRELARVKPTGWAPLHPHRPSGMERWGDKAGDLAYGVAAK